jgi:thiamine biosynthesis lipoprotein
MLACRLLVWSWLAGASGQNLRLLEAVEPHMGTLIKIKLYARDERQAKSAFRAAFDRINQLDEILSDYKPNSELNRTCRSAVRQPVKVSADLFHVLAVSQELAEKSGGAFDVTVGPVVRLWREARAQRQLPNPDALDEALSHCGFRKLHLDVAARTVLLDQDGMQLDVGGIGKGYAADQALIVLHRLGIHRALVAASGDLAFSRRWNIEIGATGRTEELSNSAVSTSGDTEQFLTVDGKRYSHIVDPSTGIALTNQLMVSIVAPRGELADGLATAIRVLGEAKGRQLALKYPGITVHVNHTP